MPKQWPTIVKLETFIPSANGSGGDYHRQNTDHWIVQGNISCPMHKYEEYKVSRTSWGIGVLGIKVHASDGTVGYATGFGGPPACWLIEEHFKRFIIGQDPRDTNKMWDMMFRASMFYGRKGLPLAAISVVDLAIWDLIGKIRGEPIYKMIGGRTKKDIPLYLTGPRPEVAKKLGFWGSKVALPHGPSDGHEGIRKNVRYLKACKEAVGEDYPVQVDCYMSLDVPYTIALIKACEKAGVEMNWWEEVLHPDDFDGHVKLKEALPHIKFTTGEHEYSKYGFRKLIENRAVDIIQPDVMWLGGLTELIKVASMAAAYDIPVVPHGSGPYSFQAIMTFPNSDFCEYIANSPDGKSIHPSFGNLFTNEVLPHNGVVDLTDEPGWGLELNPEAELVPYGSFFRVDRGLGAAGAGAAGEEEGKGKGKGKGKVNGKH
ncbi:racemase [Cryptococcus wingfieldii CBS 7118]|uniref:Racemase n=1 Tax=Cryptococcus wingfieldii CBS 7118 TaxID=1295528 RepID=A0A1E3H9T9_9TREE|nr:racemase [Cryptococcus wingfieldii CBS 7118]ODN73099.1 racemase [Cryptococcus wingfieldii CBS 7118]